MKKQQIIEVLEEKHKELFLWLENHPYQKWMDGPHQKWTTGQHILHLENSAKLLNKALSMPKFLLKYKFGTSNRTSRTYEEVAKKYNERLAENQEKTKKFNQDLKTPDIEKKYQHISKLQILNKKLQYKTNKISNKNLDTLVIPHPLMGKMTIREIIMWTAYHTEHHTETLKKYY